MCVMQLYMEFNSDASNVFDDEDIDTVDNISVYLNSFFLYSWTFLSIFIDFSWTNNMSVNMICLKVLSQLNVNKYSFRSQK